MRVQREAASSHHAQGKLRRPTVGYQRHILISSTSALCTHREAQLKGIFVHPLVQPRASLSLAQPHTHTGPSLRLNAQADAHTAD